MSSGMNAMNNQFRFFYLQLFCSIAFDYQRNLCERQHMHVCFSTESIITSRILESFCIYWMISLDFSAECIAVLPDNDTVFFTEGDKLSIISLFCVSVFNAFSVIMSFRLLCIHNNVIRALSCSDKILLRASTVSEFKTFQRAYCKQKYSLCTFGSDLTENLNWIVLCNRAKSSIQRFEALADGGRTVFL